MRNLDKIVVLVAAMFLPACATGTPAEGQFVRSERARSVARTADLLVDHDPVGAREAGFEVEVRPLDAFPWPDLIVDAQPLENRGVDAGGSHGPDALPWPDLLVDADPVAARCAR